MYWMERSPDKKWGDDLPWKDQTTGKPLAFIPGKWHTLKTEIIMNTPGQKNGSINSWLDGQLALSVKGIFRAEGATFGIDSLNFTTFFGGNTLDWAPVKDEVVYFADFSMKS